jgi:hypothetical protein
MLLTGKMMTLFGTAFKNVSCVTAHPCCPDFWGQPSLSQQGGNYHLVSAMADLTCLAVKFCSSVFLLKGPFLQFSFSVSVINDNTIPGSLQYALSNTVD